MAKRKQQAPFTAKLVRSFKEGRFSDPRCRGLWYIGIGGSRLWKHRFMVKGKENTITLGRVDEMSLGDARAKVEANRARLKLGQDPTTPVAATIAPSTFRDDALRYHAHAKGTWSPLHAKYWLQSMENHVFDIIGKMDTASVTVNDVVRVLEPLWTDQNWTAVRLHGRIKATLDHAIDTDDHERFAGGNVADRALRRLPKGQGKAQVQHPSVCWREAPDLYKRLAALDSQAARAAQLLMLCCTPRAAEIIGAKWRDVVLAEDLDGDSTYGSTLHIPAERMKSGTARDIPLSNAAVALLKTLTSSRDGYIFTGRTGKMIGGVTHGRNRERTGGTFIPFSGAIHKDAMQKLLREELKINCHVHGLRATFRTWASDHAQTVRDHDAAEICLDHAIGNRVQRAYDRADLLDERRSLAERWASFLGA